MIDPQRIAELLVVAVARGRAPVRIWITRAEWHELADACDRFGGRVRATGRFCDIPVTICGEGQSRVVFKDWSSVAWSVVCRA